MKRSALFLLTIVGLAPALPAAAQAMLSPSAQANLQELDPGKRRGLYLATIQSLRKQGMVHAALAHLDAFDQAFARDPQAQVLRADCMTDIGAYAEAAVIYRKLVAGPAGDQAESGLGRIAARQGDWAGAAEAFGRAVKRQPINIPYLNDLGFALLKAGRADDGLFRLRQALELSPNDALARNNLIVALRLAGRGDEAVRLVGAITDPSERASVEALLLTPEAQAPPLKLATAPDAHAAALEAQQ
jgi:Flp pilus assembly protein TadD